MDFVSLEKAYDEVANNWPPIHPKFYTTQGILMCKKLNNKQCAKVICRFHRLRTAHSKSQKRPVLLTLTDRLYFQEKAVKRITESHQ